MYDLCDFREKKYVQLEYPVRLLKGHAETVNSVLAGARKIDLREEK